MSLVPVWPAYLPMMIFTRSLRFRIQYIVRTLWCGHTRGKVGVADGFLGE